jgi:hypothetical protein
MERVSEIGIYEYINETFNLSKDNKILYFSIFMKRPQFLAAHMEWLYNHKYAFIGWQMMREMYEPTDEVWSHIVYLNEIEDETYMRHKYSTAHICRSSSGHCIEKIEQIGLYSYIDIYGGGTGKKLQMYFKMIKDDKIFDAHCKALRLSPQCERSIFLPVEDVGQLITNSFELSDIV